MAGPWRLLGAPLDSAGAGRGEERAPAALRAAGIAAAPAWLHLDLDVLDAEQLPAVSYPQPRGLRWDELAELIAPLLAAPGLIGVSLADLEVDLDPTGAHALRVVELLAEVWPA